MIILDSLQVKNYKNIKDIRLKNLKDFNIFIGPNNVGKTNLLRVVELLDKLTLGDESSIFPGNCGCSGIQNCWNIQNYRQEERKFKLKALRYDNIPVDEKHLRTEDIEVEFTFNKEFLQYKLKQLKLDIDHFRENLLTAVNKSSESNARKSELKSHINNLSIDDYKLTLKQLYNSLIMPCISLFSIERLYDSIKKIIFIEDSRLESYKRTNVKGYIRSKNLKGEQIRELLKFLRDIVDPNIKDYKQETLDLVFSDGFDASIDLQGSGVRSTICLAVDVLTAEKESIVLVDEPELGLNPAAKQALLKFLLREKESKQILMTTHDPTFVNPILLSAEDISIYIYSPLYDKNTSSPEQPIFVEIDLRQSKEDPYIFGGYLPHPESLKPIHIYVEGSDDVYKIQEILFSYLKEKSRFLNKIGIYHLAGSFWKHLLYTIPDKPYTSIIILDSNKVEEAQTICESYPSEKVICPKFRFCKNTDEIKDSLKDSVVPVYCLEKGNVEDIKNIKKTNLKEIFEILLGYDSLGP